MKIKKDDQVIVIAGNYKGTIAKVLKVMVKTQQLIVEGINKKKKHQKPTSQNAGGIVEVTLPIHISNVALVEPKSQKPSKVGYKIENDKKIRFFKKTGSEVS